jgi:energy-coupling factor transporter ATP-binding protein EcfA2
MIHEITVENFKCFQHPKSFQLSTINLFTGYNGRGKSTLLQALLLMSQSYYEHRSLVELDTKGIFCNLGTFQNLISKNSPSSFLSFTFKGGEAEKTLTAVYVEDKAYAGKLAEFWVDGINYIEGRTALNGTPKDMDSSDSASGYWDYPRVVDAYFSNVRFVSASRLGPTPYEEKTIINPVNPIGINGEHILNELAGNDKLKQQVSGIVSEIMDGGCVALSGDAEEEKEREILKLYFTSIEGNDRIRSINSGFGYSYVLPVIVAAAITFNGILIVENPEAHLHPQAQSRLMKALVKLAVQNHNQLYVESHSEHIVNAIRLCILQPEYPIDNNDVAIHYFDKDMTSRRLEVLADAQIPEWPSGFFDQAERDAALILRLGLFAQ